MLVTLQRGDPLYVLVLLALGLDELSMNPADIPKVKRLIRSAGVSEAKKMLEEAMAFSSHDEIERYVQDHMRTHFPLLIGDTGGQGSERPV